MQRLEIPTSSSLKKGSINNAINNTSQGEVSISVKDHNGYILTEVSDTGIGIPPDETSKIFEDFFRTSIAESKGTGLGLSIAKRIISAHGGEIWCESPCPETGIGSKFCFTLPKPKKIGGKGLSGEFSELGQNALYCVTEIMTKEDIDKLADALAEITT